MATGGSFSYTDEDTARIFTGTTGSRDFLIESSSPQLTRKLEKSLQQLTSMELHEITLAEYHKSQLIPRGLRVRIVPTLFAQNEDYKKRFTQIINKCSFDLITLTVEFLQLERLSISKEVNALELQLSVLLGHEEFLKTKIVLDEKIKTHRKVIEARKRAKMDQDRDDYSNNRVYNWTESNRFRTRFRNSQQGQQLSTSNSSVASTGSSTGASKGPFLQRGPTNVRVGEEGRKTDGVTTRAGASRGRNRQRT